MLKCFCNQTKRTILNQTHKRRTYAAGWNTLHRDSGVGGGGGGAGDRYSLSTTTLVKPPSIRIRRARLRDIPNLMRFIKNSFAASEPLVSALKMSEGKYSPALEELWRYYVDNGMSFLAVPGKIGSTDIFGAIINTRLCSWDPEQMIKFSACILCPKTKDLINLWAYFLMDSGIFIRKNNNPLFNIMHVIVDEGQCKRFHTGLTGSALATHLLNKSLRFASVKGFDLACLICTSKFLSEVAENMGMDLCWRHPYKQLLNEKMEPLLQVTNSNNTEVNMFIKELNEMKKIEKIKKS